MEHFSKYLFEIKSVSKKSQEIVSVSATTPNMIDYWQSHLKSTSANLFESNNNDFLSTCSQKIAALYKNNSNTQIGFSIGASQVYFQTLASLTKKGDTVLIEHPTYEPLKAVLKFLELNVIEINILAEDFVTQLSKLKSKHNLKVCIFTSPNMPTGKILSSAAITALQNLDCPVVVDECYLPLFINKWSIFDSHDNIISISNSSKTTGLSSLRVGWYATSIRNFKEKFDKMGTLLHVDVPTNPLNIFTNEVLQRIPHMQSQFKASISQNFKTFSENSLLTRIQAHDTIGNGGYYTTLIINTESKKNIIDKFALRGISAQTTDVFGLNNGLRISLNSNSESFSNAMSIIMDNL